MDNEKKDDLYDDDMSLLPLDFPEDEEEEEITQDSDDNSEDKIDGIKIKAEDLHEGKKEVVENEQPDEEAVQVAETEKVVKENEKKAEEEETQPPPAKKSAKEPAPIQISSNFLPGQILQEGRVRCDLSIQQVAQETKIKKGFIMALEQGDKENLPPKVYVSAYVKQLCRLYNIDSSQVLNSMADPLSNDKKVSGEILQDIEKGKQVNFQEEVRVRKFFKVVAIVILLLAVTITLVVKFAIPKTEENTAAGSEEGPVLVEAGTENVLPQQTITSADLEIFLIKQPFTMTEMEIPQ